MVLIEIITFHNSSPLNISGRKVHRRYKDQNIDRDCGRSNYANLDEMNQPTNKGRTSK